MVRCCPAQIFGLVARYTAEHAAQLCPDKTVLPRISYWLALLERDRLARIVLVLVLAQPSYIRAACETAGLIPSSDTCLTLSGAVNLPQLTNATSGHVRANTSNVNPMIIALVC
jgi:hypothetical protein